MGLTSDLSPNEPALSSAEGFFHPLTVGYAALVMYEVPASPDARPGCRDSLAITRVIFAIVVPPVAMMTTVLLLVLATIITFTISPPWALIPLALLVLVIVLFVRWALTRSAGAEPSEF